MKDSTKISLVGGICLLLGAAGGGAGVYFYCKKYFQEKADEEIQAMGEYYISKYGVEKWDENNENVNKEESNDKEQSVEEATAQVTYENISKIYRTKESGGVPTSYNNYFDESDSASGNKGKKKGKKKKLDIEVVDHEVWNENPGNFDTAFLIYYDVDGILVDEESEKIFDGSFDDEEEMKKVIESGDPDENGILIVQSNFTKTLYHVTVERMAYSEAMVADD